ncbi:translation initiation factor IF-2 N-terminal domain-containing protein, partial [Phosphitispora fastidiosa]|uniref:translation initiation factor IF-2 N-terminal domain-containing protein n=1 Tax=Phosphitispora fastidiosa TaxID=2837202 RepID=UPI001E46C16E
MGKVRVYELAKDLHLESKELLRRLTGIGIDVKNHMSTLEDEEVGKARNLMGQEKKVTDSRPEGRPQGTHPEGKPQGTRPEGRPQGTHPEGKPQGTRPEGRPQGT